MFRFSFVFLFVMTVAEQPCVDELSEDLTSAKEFSDGNIIFDGLTYPEKYIYKKYVGGEIKTFGCICKLKNCLRKCCPFNSIFNVTSRRCEEERSNNIILNSGLDLYYMNAYRKTLSVNKAGFGVLYGKPNAEMYREDSKWYLQEDGKLYIELPNAIPPWTVVGPEKYCIDTFVMSNNVASLDALVCFAEKDDVNYIVKSSCMLVSCVFILATVGVYSWLPELRNLHGRVLMSYLLCLFVGFAFLASMQILLSFDNIGEKTCLSFTFIIYFFLLSAFFWLNVMSFDIWRTFSSTRGGVNKSLSRFSAYAIYAFSVPTVLTIIMAGLEFSGLKPDPLLPNIKHQGCFLYGKSKLIYLYGPIAILCIANTVFFVLTAKKISETKKQTHKAMNNQESSSTNERERNNDQQRYLLYVKLFAVMGTNWLLEVISALYPDADCIWQYTDAYNVLIGLIIFIIFVCKPKIFQLLKNRYKQLRGYPISRTATTSSRSNSTREDINMSTIKANNNDTAI